MTVFVAAMAVISCLACHVIRRRARRRPCCCRRGRTCPPPALRTRPVGWRADSREVFLLACVPSRLAGLVGGACIGAQRRQRSVGKCTWLVPGRLPGRRLHQRRSIRVRRPSRPWSAMPRSCRAARPRLGFIHAGPSRDSAWSPLHGCR